MRITRGAAAGGGICESPRDLCGSEGDGALYVGAVPGLLR